MSEDIQVPKSGFDKILDYFNNSLNLNRPVAIAKIVEETGFSWSFIKKTLTKISKQYDGFHFEKSGSTWIAWKDRNHLIKKLNDTCSRLLDES